MPIEQKIELERHSNEAKTNINDNDVFSSKAKIVVEMINRWGMVTGIPDGEDSAGRAKLKLMPPEILVSRAFVIADLMFDELEARDWSIVTATFDELDLAKNNILEEKENIKLEAQKQLNH